MINRLNLWWRLIGGNIILIIVGIILMDFNKENAQYLVDINVITVITISLQIVTRKLSVLTEIKDTLLVYLVCSGIVYCLFVESTHQCLIACLCTIVSTTWMIKFFMAKKLAENE